MRCMLIVKASAESEAGRMPTTAELAEMTTFNEEMVKAGVMLTGEGLTASTQGARVHFSGDGSTVVNGPFPEAGKLIAGFWIIEVPTFDEAVEWARRVPFREGQIEVRKVAGEEDFGDAMSEDVKQREARMRERLGS